MNILIICSNVYELIVVIHLKNTYYANDIVDIIITNHITNSEKIAKRIESTRQFNKVYHVDALCFNNPQKELFVKECYYNLFPKSKIEKHIVIEKKYDILIAHNLNKFSQFLVDVLKRSQFHYKYGNKLLRILLCEDGIATCSKVYERFYNKTKPGDGKFRNFLDKYIYHKVYFYGNIELVYSFEPELFDWTPPFKIVKIPKLNIQDSKFIKDLNMIFEYNDKIFDFYERIIYLESLSKDINMEEYDIDEIEVVNRVANAIGKANIIVKQHPRNKGNRFQSLGYMTIKDKIIPLELVLMNKDFNDKIFLTISSNSVCNVTILFGLRIFTISLLNCLTKKTDFLEKELRGSIDKVYLNNSSNMKMPNDIDEVVELLKKQTCIE